MNAVIGFLSAAFWGVLMLSVLVFLHEGGHFLAARACGVRVTEFFLGLPCRWNIHRVSRRIGTKFGVTPLLLGGYAMICGMEPVEGDAAPRVLAFVHRRGRTTVEEIACALSLSEDDALEACVQLMGWGSLAPVYDPAKGEGPTSKYYPTTYAAMPRDAAGLTIYDGRAFDRAHATAEGEAWEPSMGEEAFFASERSRTYLGKGFWQRAFMLVAGVAVNLLSGFLLLMSIYSIVGVSAVQNVNVIGSVAEGSVAAEAGLAAGDEIRSIDGVETETWSDVLVALQDAMEDGSFELVFAHDGVTRTATIELDEGASFGISASMTVVRMNPIDSARVSWASIRSTAESIARLINPQHTMEVLDNSTSVVGISAMAADAAASGPATYLTFASLISFSLGLMNLLPIPPLDGGKLVIEVVQAVIRRPVPLKVQTALSYVGIMLFGALFIYVLRGDIVRLFL